MAYDFNAASSQNLTIASAAVTAKPLTIASFSRPTSGAQDVIVVQIGENTTNNRFVQFINSTRNMGSQVNSTTSSSISSAGSVANGTWRHGGSSFPDASEINVFLDGTKTTNAQTRTPTGIDRMSIGSRTTNDLYFPGNIAEVAIWSVALSNAEVASLAKGFKPTRIRPQSLVFYAPLIRDLQDTRGGLAITNNNSATVANHPRVY